MKIQSLLIATILAISASQTVKAQQALEASSQAATIAFTGKVQVPGYAEKDTETKEITYTTQLISSKEDKNGNITQEIEGYKMGSAAYKYGNKEILKETLGEDVSISGYALVYQDGALVAYNAKTEDIQSVDVDISALAELEAFTATTLTTTNNTYNKDGDQTSATQTYSDSGTIEGPVAVTYGGAEMIGYAAGSYKAATWYNTTEDDKGKTVLDKSAMESVIIPGAVRITGLSGSLEGESGSEVFTGSVTLAAAKAVKQPTE
jgi:hypothetical protein